MSSVSVNRAIDLNALGFPATMAAHDDDGTFTVTADTDETTLRAAVDSAPDAVDHEARRAADEQAWRDAVTAATSIADIKALLLGSNTPVSPVVDRKP